MHTFCLCYPLEAFHVNTEFTQRQLVAEKQMGSQKQMEMTVHFLFLFCSLTLGSCRSKSSTGGTEGILIGCILTWLSSQTTEEASTSPTTSSSKQTSTGRRWLLEHKKDKKGDLR